MNLYAYVWNDPVNRVDSLGLYFGIDDLIFTLGGAAVGLDGQVAGDLVSSWLVGSWQFSGWEDYVGSAVGGAAGREALLYTGPVGAGLVGGATGNLTKQLLKNLSGKQCGFAAGNFAFESTVRAATGFVPGVRIPGVTAGQGSFNQIYRQIVTKAENGTIAAVRPQTAAKMFVGRAVATGLVPGTGAAAAAGASGLIPSSESSMACKK